MNPPKKNYSLANIYRLIVNSFISKPVLFIPFLIFALVDLFGLIFLYLAPRQPFIMLLGPPIRAFWGDIFLHYPANFILLPNLEALNRMFLSISFGSLLTGMAIAMVFNLYQKKEVKLSDSFLVSVKKYIYLFTIILLANILFYFSAKIANLVLAKYFHFKGTALITINLILYILIQGMLIYAIPILLIAGENLNQSIFKSFLLFKKTFITTIALIGLPVLCFMPITILQNNTQILINKLFPEFILFIVIFGIFINSLIIDALITVSATFLYLKDREDK